MTLPIAALPKAAKTAYIIPNLQQHSLISIGQLCQYGCKAEFTAQKVNIIYNKKIILTGHYNKKTSLYHTTINQPMMNQHNQLQCNSVMIPTHATKANLVAFYHQACFSPPKSTWNKAIQQGFFSDWPGLNTTVVNKYLGDTAATIKGHLNQKRKSSTSTTQQQPQENKSTVIQIIQVPNKTYTDQTGMFPITSSHGNKYIMIMYHCPTNAILAEPIKSRAQEQLVKAFSTMHKVLKNNGHTIDFHILDNEAPPLLLEYLHKEHIKYQKVPPYVHRANTAERCIQTFKNHFIGGLCSLPKAFPMHLWCRLIPQAVITLNLMRTSNSIPTISAYEHLHKKFQFTVTPLAPPGSAIMIHEKPIQRKTWAPHAAEGWYLGPALDHYKCYRVYCTKTGAERITDTVQFVSTTPPQPAIPNVINTNNTIDEYKAEYIQTLQKLNNIFNTIYKQYPGQPSEHKAPTHNISTHHTQPTQRVPPTQHRRVQPNRLAKSKSPYAGNIEQAYAHTVLCPSTGSALEYRHLMKTHEAPLWQQSFANELGRLSNGLPNSNIIGTQTIKFINIKEIPIHKTITYGRLVVDIRPHKQEIYRTRLTVGGNLIQYDNVTATPTADLSTIKLMFNSVISTPQARFMTIDINNFYLNTILPEHEYMKIPIKIIPPIIIQHYNLHKLIYKDHIHIRIDKGMYGLPQAGILAHQDLSNHLAPYGFKSSRHTPGLWTHSHRPISFTLVVDDFGVKYTNAQDTNYLINALQNKYDITTKWEGDLYCGMKLEWDYSMGTVDISMPNYINNLLHQHGHNKPKNPVHSPSKFNYPVNKGGRQLTQPPDTSATLNSKQINTLQQIIGAFLYYGRAVDPTTLVANGDIASMQAEATEETQEQMQHLMDYAATYPLAKLRYKASAMVLNVHSDASYLTAPKARSRAGGYFFMGHNNKDSSFMNAPIHIECKIMRHVLSSAPEAEIASLFTISQCVIPLRQALLELGHPQPPTPIQTDNSVAESFAAATIKQRRSKTIDMRYYWIQDRQDLKQIEVYWKPKQMNMADYFTKHHPSYHHRKMRPLILHTRSSPSMKIERVCQYGHNLAHNLMAPNGYIQVQSTYEVPNNIS